MTVTRVKKAPEERRAEIVETARELFVAKGVVGTSVSEIVAGAGVAQGTFYWYFDSKDDVLNAVVESIVDEMCTAIETVSHSRELGLLEKIARIQDILVASAGSGCGGDFIEYFHSKADKQFHDELARGATKRLVPAIGETIRQGLDEGLFETDYPEEAASIVLAASLALHDDIVIGSDERADKRMKAYWDFVLKGLGYQGPEERP